MFLLLPFVINVHAQTAADTTAAKQDEAAGDDPSQFFTRAELFN